MLRFAPSPTGDMHIGNLRVAVINYVLAKQRQESFLLRIEDTDTARNIGGKDLEIITLLDFFGLRHDQLLYQSEHLKFHQEFAKKLLAENKAFHCHCPEETLEAKREKAKRKGIPYRYDGTCENLGLDKTETSVIRIKKPEASIAFTDAIKGDLSFEPKDVDSFVIIRQDGTPTYNFACSIDDMLHDISFIAREEEHISNTPKQAHIRTLLEYDKPITYAHLSIILNESGKKMSKRDDESSVKWLLEQGFLPEAILNYLLLIGNKTPTEIFTAEEALEWFNIAHISKAPAKFDMDKLRFINRAHLAKLDDDNLALMLGFKGADFGKIAKVYLEEASTILEIKPKIEAIFAPKNPPEEFVDEFNAIKTHFFECVDEDFNTLKNNIAQTTGLKGNKLFKPLHALLSGTEHEPELSDLYPLLKNHLKEIVR